MEPAGSAKSIWIGRGVLRAAANAAALAFRVPHVIPAPASIPRKCRKATGAFFAGKSRSTENNCRGLPHYRADMNTSFSKTQHTDKACHCLSGHPLNKPTSFCPDCGSATVEACPRCHAAIPGPDPFGWMSGPRTYQPPDHCSGCGMAFPWTIARKAAAKRQKRKNVAIDVFRWLENWVMLALKTTR